MGREPSSGGGSGSTGGETFEAGALAVTERWGRGS